MSVKNATVLIKTQKHPKSKKKKKKKKKPNFEKAVSGRLLILLTANRRLVVAVSEIY
jgi:hypothetical protein